MKSLSAVRLPVSDQQHIGIVLDDTPRIVNVSLSGVLRADSESDDINSVDNSWGQEEHSTLDDHIHQLFVEIIRTSQPEADQT